MFGSTYSLCFVLVKPFFDKYFEELKDCYMTRDFTKIPNFFGEQNLDELNYLLIDFAGYSITFLEKGITLASNFEEGLSASKLPESPFVLPVINKYNACFGKMDKIMKNIENFVNNRNNEVLNKLF